MELGEFVLSEDYELSSSEEKWAMTGISSQSFLMSDEHRKVVRGGRVEG